MHLRNWQVWVVVVAIMVFWPSEQLQAQAGRAATDGWEFFSSPTQENLGPVWGQYRNVWRLEREEAAARHNYCPTSGCVIRIDRLGVFPKRVQRGRQAYFSLTYTILTADDVGVPVTISREIFFQDKSLG